MEVHSEIRSLATLEGGGSRKNRPLKLAKKYYGNFTEKVVAD